MGDEDADDALYQISAWITECYSYTSGGSDYSRQVSCDGGCPSQHSYNSDDCSGTSSQISSLSYCTLCESGGDYCYYQDGAAQKMVFMVFAVVVSALWSIM